MTQSEKQVGYYRSHTVKVQMDGEEQEVAILYLENLKESLGKRLSISKEEQARADDYLGVKERRVEAAKATNSNKKKK